ncbi:hypothetical protein MM239_14635 [Belliella sp. DSM 111904]|uniref:Uncharacterized protein n=1 Tax=Belliella filtrata TaxID=2923435 RepID=A0ABS9V2K3_9BACT|nr:hypothetical protein [Belliella filtrata]MCH7410642.1 hypothetical protein [Belliella filtrata]
MKLFLYLKLAGLDLARKLSGNPSRSHSFSKAFSSPLTSVRLNPKSSSYAIQPTSV